MITELKHDIERRVAYERRRIDKIRMNTELLRFELRGRKEEIVADLERAYRRVGARLDSLRSASLRKAERVGGNARVAWLELKMKLDHVLA